MSYIVKVDIRRLQPLPYPIYLKGERNYIYKKEDIAIVLDFVFVFCFFFVPILSCSNQFSTHKQFTNVLSPNNYFITTILNSISFQYKYAKHPL